ncbi:MAG: hypothetical protein WDZ51_05320 [Pirellulaceae bacterium]
MPDELPGNLSGRFHVRMLRDALRDAQHWIPRTGDLAVLRRHSLKLRFWPGNLPDDTTGLTADLDWSWIRALKGQGHEIGELRIHETIGGCDNLRVIFYRRSTREGELPTIWIIAVFQKKRDDFTSHQFKIFKGRKALVDERADTI